MGLIRRAWFPATRPKWRCTTNNYAVKNLSQSAALVNSHMGASRWFTARPELCKRLDGSLSVMNRSLASQTTLAQAGPLTRRGLLKKYRRYRRLYERRHPPDLAWAEPYISRMAELMSRLRLR